MNSKVMEEKFLDYVEGALSETERQQFEAALESDPALKKSFAEYREIISLEGLLAQQDVPQMASLENKLFARISEESEEDSNFKGSLLNRMGRFLMHATQSQRYAFASVTGVMLVLLCIKLSFEVNPASVSETVLRLEREKLESEAVRQQGAGGPTVAKEISDDLNKAKKEEAPIAPKNAVAPVTQLPLTPGNRAVTIEARQTAGIEGYVQPGARVDLVLTTKKDGKIESKIIAQDARVLSAGGETSSGKRNSSSITLGVDTQTALKIQEARQLGEVTTIMRGEEDNAAAVGSGRSVVVADELSVSTSSSQRKGDVLGKVVVDGRTREILKDGSMREVDKNPARSKSKNEQLTQNLGSDSKRVQVSAARELSDLANYDGPAQPGLAREMALDAEFGKKSIPEYSGNYAGKPMPYCCQVPPPSIPSATANYTSYEENPRMSVAQEPMSTFSIDVDTASYSQARKFLQAGHLPPQDSVRIEEFLNYFDYSYPVQTEKPFTLSYEMAPSPLEKDRYLLKLGIKARDVSPYEGGWNLVFLVDVSGSMMPDDRLPLVKRAMSILVEKMKPEDRIAIVTYAGNAGLVLDSTSIKEKSKILSAISNIGAGGSTHGSAGINLAYEIAQRHFQKGAVNRVILATDGDFNVGTTSKDELIRLIEEKRKSGITLTTIGVGQSNLKDGMLEQLADKGNGNYFYLDTLKEARKVMEDDLTKNMEVVAKDVKLQIEFNPSHVKQYRLIGYDNRRLQNKDFNNDKVDAGEIGAGHTVTAIYEVVLAGTSLASSEDVDYRYKNDAKSEKPIEESRPKTDTQFASELAFLKIRYKEPEGELSKLLQYPIEASKIQSDSAKTSDDFRFAAAVSYFGTLLRGSKFVGTYTYAQIAELAKAARGTDSLGYRQEFVDMVKNAAALKPGFESGRGGIAE